MLIPAGTPDDGTVPQCGLPRRTSDMLLSITHTDENEKQQQQQQEEKEEDEEEEEEDTALAENHILVDREQPQREAGTLYHFFLPTPLLLMVSPYILEPVAARSSTHAGSNPVCVWMRLAAYQYVALLMKRFHYSRRKIAALIVQFVCPLLVILMCLVISHYNESIPDPPPLLFRPSLFFGINDYNYVFVGGVNNTPALPHYANTLLRPCGLGAEILDSSTNPSSPCYAGRQPDECTHYPNPFYNCSCDCSGRASPPSLPVCFNGTVVSVH